jgi:hypothetical protein
MDTAELTLSPTTAPTHPTGAPTRTPTETPHFPSSDGIWILAEEGQNCDNACRDNGGRHCDKEEFKAAWKKLSREQIIDGFSGLYGEKYADAISKTPDSFAQPSTWGMAHFGTTPYDEQPQDKANCFLRNGTVRASPMMLVYIEDRASKPDLAGSIRTRFCYEARRTRLSDGESETYTDSKGEEKLTWLDDVWGDLTEHDCGTELTPDTAKNYQHKHRVCFCGGDGEDNGPSVSEQYEEITRDASEDFESINEVNQVYNSAWEQYRAAILESGSSSGGVNALKDLAQKKVVWAVLDACIKTRWAGELELTGALRAINSIVNGSALVPDYNLHDFIVNSATSVVPWHNEGNMAIIAFNPLRDQTVETCAINCDGFGSKYLPQCEMGRYKKTAAGECASKCYN